MGGARNERTGPRGRAEGPQCAGIGSAPGPSAVGGARNERTGPRGRAEGPQCAGIGSAPGPSAVGGARNERTGPRGRAEGPQCAGIGSAPGPSAVGGARNERTGPRGRAEGPQCAWMGSGGRLAAQARRPVLRAGGGALLEPFGAEVGGCSARTTAPSFRCGEQKRVELPLESCRGVVFVFRRAKMGLFPCRPGPGRPRCGSSTPFCLAIRKFAARLLRTEAVSFRTGR